MEKVKYQEVSRLSLGKDQKQDAPPEGEGVWPYIRSKIEAAIWVIIFFGIYERTKITKEIFANPRINQTFLTIFLLSFGINFSIVLFVALVVPYLGYQNYEDYSPHITPFGSIVMAVGFLSCVIAVYPVYGFWSILIVPAFGMGFLMLAHFIPFKGNTNSLILFTIFGLLLLYSYYFH